MSATRMLVAPTAAAAPSVVFVVGVPTLAIVLVSAVAPLSSVTVEPSLKAPTPLTLTLA